MHHWYVMIIYIVHDGSISANGLYPVADLYASQSACESTLQRLHFGPTQKAVCAPVAPMKVDGSIDVQVTQEEWIQRQLQEMRSHSPE